MIPGTFEPIAVVGVSCLLPGCRSPSDLWRLVIEGRDALVEVPSSYWRADRDRLLFAGAAGCLSGRAGIVEGFAFDPARMAIDAGLARALDPSFLWTLHCAREALDSAGLAPGSDERRRCGLVLGNLAYPTRGMAELAEAHWAGRHAPPEGSWNRFSAGLPAHLACAALGLGGGGFAIDAACASSLYSLKLACDRLQDRDADTMLAGAVNCIDGLVLHAGFTALGAISPSGRSRPFHREADGLVPAEGCAMAVLRRLEDAIHDGGRILGVIRGIGLSNDGRSGSLVAPSRAGQTVALAAAYACAGLAPRDVTLVECHATGTPVGDATELESTGGLFRDAPGTPIGSLKANIGHSITVSGLAGLIKVLGAIEHGVRPPGLHTSDPAPAFARSPFRLLAAPEPWPAPRRAALSSFGFGGNNAHVIVEEWTGELEAAPATRARGRVAVVAMGAEVAGGHGVADLADSLAGRGPAPAEASEIRLPAAGLRFPPRDLDHTLPQQLAVLAAAIEATGALAAPLPEATAVLVGTECDVEACRHALRLRLPDLCPGIASDFVAPLDAAAVVGCMPNIPANRIGRQFDCRAPGFSVFAEELSGVRALQVACRMLLAGEAEAAVVGAVDLCCEPVHAACARAVLPEGRHVPGDAALALVLRREADAVAAGDPILALVADGGRGDARLATPLPAALGHAHAASGLLAVAAAVIELSGGGPGDGGGVCVEVDGLFGQHAAVCLVAGPAACESRPLALPDRILRLPAHAPPMDLRRPAEPEAMAKAPVLAPVRETVAPGAEPPAAVGIAQAPGGPLAAARQESQAPTQVPGGSRSEGAAPSDVVGMFGAITAHHREAIERQVALHRRFLAVQATAMRVAGWKASSAPGPADRGSAAALPRGPGPEPAVPPADRVPAGDPAAPRGPTFDRRQLEVLAGGRISSVLGQSFAPQDSCRRQVRLPEPPLLLIGRVLGIDAEPASMGVGTIWTETVVADDAWYLHDGHMPAGITVEAGQADLLLISWLGADLLNRDDRVYRLLGCDLTFWGGLPAAGETLRYDIHIDSHVRQGPVRLFFFHSDCRSDGTLRLAVRGGQAGFFSDEELDASAGVLWEAGNAAPTPAGRARVDSPFRPSGRRSMDEGQLAAFAEGDVLACFGPGFELAASHSRTPRPPGGRLRLLDRVTAIDHCGGPWGRGYLRAETTIAEGSWFFAGHFKDDPCMPGTLMLEGCMQAMSIYLAAQGHTLRRDGWRFEPVPGHEVRLRCRGQVTPRSRTLVTEVFVDEIEAGPLPRLFADVLCTVDGLRAFHAGRLGVQLTPGWPLGDRALALVPRAAARSAERGGVRFDEATLLACALGRPSRAFGEPYRRFDGPRRVPRLPGPPYHFMSRVTDLDLGPAPGKAGCLVEAAFDLDQDGWTFEDGQALCFCALLEAGLQPCGWLASAAGCAIDSPADLHFRNLDGTGTQLAPVPRGAGTLSTRATLVRLSRLGEAILCSFDVETRLGDLPVYRMETSFGFFVAEALADRTGLPASPDDEARLAAPGCEPVDLEGRPAPWLPGRPAQPGGMLALIDRITAFDPEGGRAGLGFVRGEKDVDPGAWYFRAHFFQDPVQPGSIGLQMLLQLLQYHLVGAGLIDGLAEPILEAPAIGKEIAWKYRGQVLPTDRRVVATLDVLEVERDPLSVCVTGQADLWVDGRRIYHASRLSVRARSAARCEREFSLDPADPLLADHRPTFTVPALPMMVAADLLARAATELRPGARLVELRDLEMRRWVCFPGGPRRLRRRGEIDGDVLLLGLDVFRDSARPGHARFEEVARATALVAADWPQPPPAWQPLSTAETVHRPGAGLDLYEEGRLFHGPRYRSLLGLAWSESGATFDLDAGQCADVAGEIAPALLDGLTHAIPNDDPGRFASEIGLDWIAYPSRLVSLRLYGPPPRSGTVHGEMRFDGSADSERRCPRFLAQLQAGGTVWAEATLVSRLFPKGPIGAAPPSARRAFLRDRAAVPGLGLSRPTADGGTRLRRADVDASRWLPGTLAGAWSVDEGSPDLLADIAIKEHAARRLGLHPSAVAVDPSRTTASTVAFPLNPVGVSVEVDDEGCSVCDAGPELLATDRLSDYWLGFSGGRRTVVLDLYLALARTFVRRVYVSDPVGLAACRGRPVLFLANHQVAAESLVASLVAGALTSCPVRAVAKAEHRTSWIGGLLDATSAHPEVRLPRLCSFFSRDDPQALLDLLADYRAGLSSEPTSLLVHVEGTRSLRCREPTKKLSSKLVDLAADLGLPVIPLRLAGGLPVEPAASRLEFPVGFGRQDIAVGAPIDPGHLTSLPYAARKAPILEAINALPPVVDREEPGAPRAELARLAREQAARLGVDLPRAVLVCLLMGVEGPSDETREIAAWLASGGAPADAPAWSRRFCGWLLGEGGR